MAKYEKGKIVKGTVSGIETYGIFVSFDEFYSGLIHISELSHSYVKDINEFVKIGDIIYTEVLDVDEDTFQLKLSIKNNDYRKKSNFKRKPIEEPPHGFKTLEKKLPNWIKENLENK